MRGELPAALSSVGRGSGVAGVVAAVAGAAAVAGLWRPWYAVTAELGMLGAAESRTVVAIDGWASAPAWLAAAAGLLALVLGVALAVDRHPGWTRPTLLAAAVGLAAAGSAAQVLRPSLDRFPDAEGALAELRTVAADLPAGVELSLTVRPGAGATAALLAGVTVLLATAAARDLDRR